MSYCLAGNMRKEMTDISQNERRSSLPSRHALAKAKQRG